MSVLQNWYPGDRAVEYFLIVAVGVMVLTTAAWVVARRLSKKPALRHLILISALCGSLAMPGVALIFGAAGFTLIAIPVLPAVPYVPESGGGQTRSTPVAVSHYSPASAGPEAETARPPRPVDATTRSEVRSAAPAFAMPPQAVSWLAPLPPPRQLVPARWTTRFRPMATLALAVWACGTGLLLLRLGRSWQRICRLRRSAAAPGDARLSRLFDEVGHVLKVGCLPRVGVSPLASTPLAFGCWRPMIVLPNQLVGAVSDDEMRDVLLHELAHLIRRDPLMVLLQELARAMYWPIVPAHSMIRELGRAREELCDNYVLQGRDALSYGETLLHLAVLSQGARPLFAAVGIVQWTGELERRIAGLLDQGRSTMTKNNRWLVWLVALFFATVGTIAAATRLSAEGRASKATSSKADETKRANVARGAAAKADKKPQRSMLIHVLGPDGRPMTGVKIHRSVWSRKPGTRGNADYVSDDRGEARLDIPDEIYIVRLWARVKGYVPLHTHWEEEDKPETTLPAEFTIRLRRGTTIGGVVKDSAGQPIKGVMVEVMVERGFQQEGRTGPDMWLATQDPQSRQITVPVTDEHGRWTLDDVPPDADLELRLKFSHADYVSDSNWGTLQEQQGIDLKALIARTATIVMQGGIVATGTVADPQGKPIAGAIVVRGDHPYWATGNQEVRTDEIGRYRLPPLPSGKVTVTVIAPGWMPAMTKIDVRKGMRPVDFRLRPGNNLRIRFVDQSQKPIPGVAVGIHKWRGGESLYNIKNPYALDTSIPLDADAHGIFQWTWAPDDSVTYQFEKEGHVRHEATLTANGSEQTVTLPKLLRISGKVTNQAGRPIKGVTAIPVLEFGAGSLHVRRNDARGPFDGVYTIEGDRTDVSYRVRVEAPGYRSAMSDVAKAGAVDPTFDFRLVAGPPVEGRLVDLDGRPVKGASVYLATHSQNLNDWPAESERGMIPDAEKVVTDGQGRFTFPAQFERYAVVAVDDRGYAEVHRGPNEQPGDMTLKAWARVEGRLMHAGEPMPSAWIIFAPVRPLGGNLPHIQDSFSAKTDRDGRFVFARVPPVKSHVRAQLSVWRDFPFSSSQSVPLDLQPGETVHLNLGGEGTQVKGRVVLSGAAASKIDLHKSQNWLMRRAPGIEPPPDLRASGLSAREGWNNAWTSTLEGHAFIETLHTYFVVLDKDGRFQISGVPAGDYDLALRLYEPPGDGCLVSPVGSRIVRCHVTEEAARASSIDLGEIPVSVAIGPRIGDLAPDFTAATFSGGTITLSSLRGRFVLLDFWATWCGPCVANLPVVARLHDTFAADKRVTILGLNLDDEVAAAQALLDDRKLPLAQAHLGGRAMGKDDVLSRYAISFIPTYILIGSDGKLVYRGDDLEEIGRILRREAP